MIELPDELLEVSGFEPDKVVLDVAISLYQQEKISLGKAAQLAGLHRWAFQQILGKRKIPLNYSLSDLEKDFQTVSNMVIA